VDRRDRPGQDEKNGLKVILNGDGYQ